jgi:hypothetical protein
LELFEGNPGITVVPDKREEDVAGMICSDELSESKWYSLQTS